VCQAWISFLVVALFPASMRSSVVAGMRTRYFGHPFPDGRASFTSRRRLTPCHFPMQSRSLIMITMSIIIIIIIMIVIIMTHYRWILVSIDWRVLTLRRQT
jgi:hypothetical protein